ncbi:MAG TPA: hypothetical protein VLC06_13255 [Polyangia bacterium]|nr:hypothetical protein [Polyangia bacterium]
MSHPDCAPGDTIDQIEISSPCTVSWGAMRAAGGAGGDERVRFCGQCRQNVYNVEAMSRGEARRLIAAREGRVCVRILRRPDGTVVTADCWARLRAARRRGFLPFLGMMVLVGLTEIMAIGVGLCRLRGLLAGPPPPAPQMPHVQRPDLLLWDIDRPRMMGLIGPPPPVQPSVPALGEFVPRHHLVMGRPQRK